MTEQANMDRYVETGMSLRPVIRLIDQTASRALDPLYWWRVANWEKEDDDDAREMTYADAVARDWLKDALAGLTPAHRSVLYDVFCPGMGAGASATSKGLPSSTGPVMFRDALEALNRHLAERHRNPRSTPAATTF